MQALQGKVWVWGQGGPSAESDSAAVKPALIPELRKQWPPTGHDGQPWEFFAAQYMRDLPYGAALHTMHAKNANVIYPGLTRAFKACMHLVPVSSCRMLSTYSQKPVSHVPDANRSHRHLCQIP